MHLINLVTLILHLFPDQSHQQWLGSKAHVNCLTHYVVQFQRVKEIVGGKKAKKKK